MKDALFRIAVVGALLWIAFRLEGMKPSQALHPVGGAMSSVAATTDDVAATETTNNSFGPGSLIPDYSTISVAESGRTPGGCAPKRLSWVPGLEVCIARPSDGKRADLRWEQVKDLCSDGWRFPTHVELHDRICQDSRSDIASGTYWDFDANPLRSITGAYTVRFPSCDGPGAATKTGGVICVREVQLGGIVNQ